MPGKAYAMREHVWLTGANEVDSKFFTRAILAKVTNQKKIKGIFFFNFFISPLNLQKFHASSY